MDKRSTKNIMWLFTISMAGFLIAQIFWITGALKAMDETFVLLNVNSLRSVVQQTGKITHYHYLQEQGNEIDTNREIIPDSLFSECGFDALIKQEFGHYRLHSEYEYGIIDHLTGRLHLSSAENEMTGKIFQSPYKRSLRNVLDTDRYSVVVWFPYERMVILRAQSSWLLWLSVLLFMGITIGYLLTITRLFTHKRLTMMQNDFINNTTHEFKTPIATISVAAEMILYHRSNMPESQVEKYAAIIYEENKRLQRQVDQVLQLSFLEEEMYRFDMKPLRLQPLLERVVETGILMLRERGGSIFLEGSYEGEIIADKLHLTNVFNNLVENGIKYSLGEPQLKVSIFKEDDGVYIKFTDKGIGISSGELDRIFDRLYRVPTGDLYNAPGTGIGLYYVKKVINAHNGAIMVNSVPGEGSCFEVFLPYQQPEV